MNSAEIIREITEGVKILTGGEVEYQRGQEALILLAVAASAVFLRLFVKFIRSRRGMDQYSEYWSFAALSDMNLRKLSRRGLLFHLPKLLLVMAAIPFFFALADPVLQNTETTERKEARQFILVQDFSYSMQDDEKLRRSVSFMEEFIEKRNNSDDEYAFLAFSENVYIVSYFTDDFHNFRYVLDTLDFMRYGEAGTRIDLAIDGARKFFARHGGAGLLKKTILIFSDADSNEDPENAINQAAKDGITIYLVGIGAEISDTPSNSKKMINDVLRAGGDYFPTEKRDSLDRLVQKIDKISKSAVEKKLVGHELLFEPFAKLALALFAAALLLFISPWFRDYP